MSDDRPAAQLGDQPGGVSEPDQPVTFRDVFAVREFRALYFSLIVNWVGDYLARAAIIVLVYQQSQSVLLSAASFAVSYLPWIVGGPGAGGDRRAVPVPKGPDRLGSGPGRADRADRAARHARCRRSWS